MRNVWRPFRAQLSAAPLKLALAVAGPYCLDGPFRAQLSAAPLKLEVLQACRDG